MLRRLEPGQNGRVGGERHRRAREGLREDRAAGRECIQGRGVRRSIAVAAEVIRACRVECDQENVGVSRLLDRSASDERANRSEDDHRCQDTAWHHGAIICRGPDGDVPLRVERA